MASKTSPLPIEEIDRRFDPDSIPFNTTDEIEAPHRIIGQHRAIEAIDLALQIDRAGYNLFTAGPRGTGKRALVREKLAKAADRTPPQRDWFYTYNFRESHKPEAMSVPSGRGAEFKRAMDQLVTDLQSSLSAAFQGEDYRNAVQSLQEEVEESQSSRFDEIREDAKSRGLALIQTPMGWAFAPMEDGRVMQPEKFNELSEEERHRIEGEIREMQEKLRTSMQDMPKVLQATRERMRELNRETAEFAVRHLIEGLKAAYSDIEEIVHYLDLVKADVIANTEVFLAASQQPFGGPQGRALREGQQDQDQGSAQGMAAAAIEAGSEDNFFRRYKVNLIIDNSETDHAPVIYEDEPTFERLVGRIEHRAEMGALITDFNLIRGGALHRANGGYLMLDARKLLTQPAAWDALKRALEAGEIRIEPMSGAMGLPRTTTLEPEPIPLSVKVVLMGESWIYYLLNLYDPDFPSLFKILADFDERLERTEDYTGELSRMVAGIAKDDSLRAFDRTAVARLLDHLSRMAGDRERLSTNLEDLQDVMREASHLVSARNGGHSPEGPVTAADVDAALDARRNRANRVSERMQEEMLRETLLIDTDGAQVGQINGLSVYMLGGESFGKPSRITARVRIGRGNVVDIEREVELGGPLHSKGVMILSGYLGANYAHDVPLSLSASLVFEQSYGGVDGDSASSAELYALLSALSDVPINQGFAVTGSVNQLGEVQAIGGVNEKIEGFFDLCNERGLTGEQGVLIPRSNVKHLILHGRVRDAIEAGRFAIYLVDTIDQGIEILTGEAAETINRKVDERLRSFALQLRKFARPGEEQAD